MRACRSECCASTGHIHSLRITLLFISSSFLIGIPADQNLQLLQTMSNSSQMLPPASIFRPSFGSGKPPLAPQQPTSSLFGSGSAATQQQRYGNAAPAASQQKEAPTGSMTMMQPTSLESLRKYAGGWVDGRVRGEPGLYAGPSRPAHKGSVVAPSQHTEVLPQEMLPPFSWLRSLGAFLPSSLPLSLPLSLSHSLSPAH